MIEKGIALIRLAVDLTFLVAFLDILNITIVEDLAFLHNGNSCAEVFSFIKAVGCEQHRSTTLLNKIKQISP